MKKYWMTGFALSMLMTLRAQQQEGKIVYERTSQLQISIAGMDENAARNIPQTRTDKMEVIFGKNQSLRRAVVDETPEPTNFESGGIMIRTFAAGAEDITYHNYSEKKHIDQREFGGKKYIVADSIRSLEWKLTGETKAILGLPCQQAKAQRIGNRFSTTIVDGEPRRVQQTDTSNIIVWFTPAIPVPAGPEYQGQLPGAILEIDINDGRTVYKATEISPKADLSVIKEPKSGKKVTAAEFDAEREKLLKEMQRNNGDRGRVIRMN
jgi:GLPGLI family protein